MLKRFTLLTVLLASLTAVFAPSWAHAASLRVCYDDTSVTADMSTIQALADGELLFVDVLAGSTLTGTKRCSTQTIPATLPRGKDVAVTLKAFNAFGEGGPASAPVSFHSPAIPGNVTGAAVSIVLP